MQVSGIIPEIFHDPIHRANTVILFRSWPMNQYRFHFLSIKYNTVLPVNALRFPIISHVGDSSFYTLHGITFHP